MKQLVLSITIILVALIRTLPAAAEEVSMEGCNSLYFQGSYEKAIECYQDLGSGSMSAALFYNIGNSYAKLDKPGYSILNYLRALHITPRDSDISGNIALVKKEKGLFPPEQSVITNVLNRLTTGQWALICILALALYLVFALTRLKTKNNLYLESSVIVFCVLLFSIGAAGVVKGYQKWQQAVVISDSRLLLSPYDTAASIGSIKEGRLVMPHKKHNQFWYVTDETGRKGWLHSTDFDSILPPE